MKNLKIFFTSDVHGSNLVFRKIISISQKYDLDIVIISGDLLGKELRSIVKYEDRFEAVVGDKKQSYSSFDNLKEIKENIENQGHYIVECDGTYLQILQSDFNLVMEVMKEKMIDRLHKWIKLIEEKADLSKIIFLISPGNDDILEIDDPMKSVSREGIYWLYNEIITIYGYEILTYSDSNKTPWNTEREKEEKVLRKELKYLFKKLKRPTAAICNIHCPPYKSKLDKAPELDKNLKPIITPGAQSFVHIGCMAVHEIIEYYQPLIALHGHVHESPGVDKIGKTLCINPGSEYWNGTLHGYIIEIEEDTIKNYYKIEG